MNKLYKGESGKDFAQRLFYEHFGREPSSKETGAGSDFNKIKNGAIEDLNNKDMKKVYYALYHVYEDEQANKDEEKFIGLFSTARKARQVIEELRYLPGFNKFPKKEF